MCTAAPIDVSRESQVAIAQIIIAPRIFPALTPLDIRFLNCTRDFKVLICRWLILRTCSNKVTQLVADYDAWRICSSIGRVGL
jgi:hypothetical protein